MSDLPVISQDDLRLALQDLLSDDVGTGREDLRDLRRILANLPDHVVRRELSEAITRKLTEGQS